MISLPLLSLALLLPGALAAPRPAPHADPIHIPILRRSASVQDRVAKLPDMMDAVRSKYGFQTVNRKRSTTSTAITDELNDSSYSASISIGTPAQTFNLILDTGSSDLWVATDQCTTCTTNNVPLFNPSKSSTYKNETFTVGITYGSGSVNGYASQDTVGFSGFTIADQQLLSVSSTSSNLLSDGLSGIIGLGFQTLSALNATPFWEALYTQNKLSLPVFGFYLERYVNQAQQINAAPGGTFTLGGTNTSLYTGNVELINMPSGTTPSYWLQQVQGLTVQGKSISISSNQGLAAIDTGTTLIGAPSTVAQDIYSNIPGSVALGSNYQGMYAFPCSTNVSIALSFGGAYWPISAADMNIGTLSGTGSTQMCAGGIFDIGSTVGNAQGVPSWIIGDTFLKNVYTVFQANPPAVGFAALSSGLNGNTSTGASIGYSGGASSPLPTGTSGASPNTRLSTSVSLLMTLLAGFVITL